MTVHRNDSENFINDQEHVFQYHSFIIIGRKVKTLKLITTQVIMAQLDGVSNYHVFVGITVFTYIRPVKCNVQISNGSKAPAKVFGLVVVTFQNNHHYTTLAIIIYTTKPTKHNK